MPTLATVTSYLNNNNQDELANVDKGVWGKDIFIPVFIISLFTVVRFVEIN